MRKLGIAFAPDGNDFVHRARNFAEDLHRAFLADEKAVVSLEDIDRMTDHLPLLVRATRDIGDVEHTIRRTLRKHSLSGEIRRA